jgi:nitric oxide reductase NorQ protein
MALSVGTVVKVEQDNTGFLTVLDQHGNRVSNDEVPKDAIKKAFEGNFCIELIPTSTGGTQWRKRPMEVYLSKSNPTGTVAHTAVDTTKLDKPVLENLTEHSEVVAFIHKSYVHKPKLLKIDELRWKFAVRSVIRGDNLMIRGDAGCGKTKLAMTLGDIFGRPFFYFNLGATQDPRGALIGNTHFKKDEGTYVAEALFVKAIQTPNAIILLDEVSRAHPDAHNILMTVLDKTQRYLRIDERPDTPTIRVAEGVTFVGTANVGSEYTATRTMDRAFVDRWTVVMMEPLALEQEVELLSEMFPNLDPADIDAIAEIAVDTRKQVRSDNPKVDTIISTRVTTEMAALIYDGFTLGEAAQVKIFPLYSDAGGAESPRTYMKQLVQRFIRDDSAANKPDPFSNSDPNDGFQKPWGN